MQYDCYKCSRNLEAKIVYNFLNTCSKENICDTHKGSNKKKQVLDNGLNSDLHNNMNRKETHW